MNDPQGIIAVGVDGLRRMVAECPAFQQRVRKDTVPAASKKVHRYCFSTQDRKEMESARPFALIRLPEEVELQQQGGGARNLMIGGGEVLLVLTDRDRDPNDWDASTEKFVTWIDAVLTYLAVHAGEDDRLDINSIRVFQNISHNRPEEAVGGGGYWDATFLVSWGLS